MNKQKRLVLAPVSSNRDRDRERKRESDSGFGRERDRLIGTHPCGGGCRIIRKTVGDS